MNLREAVQRIVCRAHQTLVLRMLVFASFVLLGGCYMSHERPPDSGPAPSIDAGPVPRVGTRVEDSGADAGVDDAGFGFPHDELDVCLDLCESWRSSGCPLGSFDECYRSCDSRRWAAYDRGCYEEFKGTTSCIANDPCAADDGHCGEEHGWAECIGARP